MSSLTIEEKRARAAENQRRYRKRNPGLCAQRIAAWRAANPEEARAIGRRYWHRHRERLNHERRLARYGLTAENYEALWEQQEGRCGICARELVRGLGQRGTHVDHCHSTDRVRGLLCFECNTGLGKLGDDPARLRAALVWLDE